MPSSDLNLLFGILALQLNFITREALISAMGEWILTKDLPLGMILQAAGHLSLERRQLLDALVQEHLRQHAGDAQQSLAALSSIQSARDMLQAVNDSELQASIAHLNPEGPVRHDAETVVPKSPFHQTTGGGTDQAAGTRFRILRPHARGGLGQVSVALDEELHREVALKEIQGQHADNIDSRSRFVLEAEITGRLEHPGIVPVYGLGHYADGRPFYAMRFIQGDSLKEAIEAFHRTVDPAAQSANTAAQAERNVQFRQLLRRFVDVCNTMAYAHSRGILHRDLKPGNIMVGKYGETLVVDWGLAKSLGHGERTTSPEVKETTLLPTSGNSSETLPGLAIGTPGYMSPEQAAGNLEDLGPPSDVYSLGATLYHILTGQSPFEGRNVTEILQKVQRGDFPKPSQLVPSTPKPLEAICLQAMALEPKRRYTSPRLLADDIEHWLADEPVTAVKESVSERLGRWSRRHRSWIQAGIVAMALVLGVTCVSALILNQQRREAEALAREKNDLAIKEQRAREAESQLKIEAQALANDKSVLAEKEKHARLRAESETRRAFRIGYLSAMKSVQRDWDEGQIGVLKDRLVSQLPMQTGGIDLRRFEWYLWDSLSQRSLATIDAHTDRVWTSVFSPDGRQIATAALDNRLCVWNVITRQSERLLQIDLGLPMCLAFSRDGKRLAGVGTNGRLTIWNLEDGTSSTVALAVGDKATLFCVVFSPNGQQLATAGEDGLLRVVGADNLIEKASFKGSSEGLKSGETNSFRTVAFSPNGQFLVASGFKGVEVWDWFANKRLTFLPTYNLTRSLFSADGTHIGIMQGLIGVFTWHAFISDEIQAKIDEGVHIPFWNCNSYDAYPENGHIVGRATGNSLVVEHANSHHQVLVLRGHSKHVHTASFSPNGRHVVTGSEDSVVKLWDLQASRDKWVLKRPQWEHTTSIAFRPDGRQLASIGSEGSIKLWDVKTGQLSFVLKAFDNWGASVSYSPDGTQLAASSDRGLPIQIWDPKSGTFVRRLTGTGASATKVAFGPTGKLLAIGSRDGPVQLWDVSNKQDRLVWIGGPESHGAQFIEFMPGGKDLLHAAENSQVTICNAETGQPIRILSQSAATKALACSPTGKSLAIALSNQSLCIWDSQNWQVRHNLKGHAQPVGSLVFSPDGDRLVSISTDNVLKVWDVDTGTELLTFHSPDVNANFVGVAFDRSGFRLAATNGIHGIDLWDGRPTTLEVKTEREAIGVLNHWLQKPQVNLIDSLRADPTVTEPVRQMALELASEHRPTHETTIEGHKK